MLRSSRPRVVALLATAALSVAGAVTLTSAHADTPDTQAPTLASYRVLPGTVDDTAGDTSATVVVRIRDAAQSGATASGFSNGTITLASATNTLDTVGFTDSDRVSGTPFDGTYDVDVTVPQGSPAGSYAASLYLEDFAGANATVGGTSPLAVTRANDTTAPALVSLTANATDVDVTAGDRSVTFTARLTDTQSGVASARLTLAGPDGAGDVVDFDRTSGSAQDGVWTATERFSSYSTPGTWSGSGLTLTDAFGNAATVTAGLQAAAITVHATVDTTKPTLSSLTLDRSSVDVSDGAKTVRVTVHAGDDASGISTGHVTFAGDDGYSQADADLSPAPTAGSVTDGTWTADVTFDTAAKYTLSEVTLTDNQGNQLTLCTPATPPDPYDPTPDSDCDGPQPAATVTVTASDDSVAPTAGAFTVGPATATTAYQGAARVDGSFTVADATSGFGGATVTFVNGSASTAVYLSPYDLVSGTVHAGTVGFSTYFDVSDAGTWTVASLEVDDLAGNATTYTSGLGSVSVVTTRNDSAAPVVTNVRVTPNPISTTGGAQTATVTATVSDVQAGAVASGVSDTTVTLASPGGVLTDVDLDTLAGGNSVTGTWTGTTTIGQYAEPGTWTVVAAAVTDQAGLERDYAAGSSALAGGSFAVTSATDTSAPVVTGLSVPSPTVDLTGADRGGVTVPVHVQATDTGSGIDDVAVTLTGPGGQQRSATTPVDNALTLDTDVLVTVPSFSSAGTWTVTGVDLLSDRGPDTHWTNAGASIGASFLVVAPADTTGPAVTGLTVTPSPVDTDAAPAAADVLVHLVDAGSGAARGWATLTSPHGYQTLSTGLTLVAGNAGDGWWQGSITLPRYVDAGAWRVSVSAVDALGNGTDASGSTLTGAGLPATITVTGHADPTAPRLTNLTLNHSTLDAAALSSGGWLTVATTAKDDDSGVAAVEVTITAPNGTTQTVTGSPVAASTPSDASYVAAVPLASLQQRGTWTVSSVVVRDLTGNASTSGAAQLAAWPTTFSVQSLPGAGTTPVTTSPPPVPTNVTAILAGTTAATVSWAAPSSTVTGYTVTPYRDGVAQATVAVATTSTTFTGLARGASYSFVVRAANDAGSSEPSVPSITLVVPAVAPGAPTIGAATLLGTTATVTFGAPADDGGAAVTSYAVTPWAGGSAGTPVTVTGSARSATLTGLPRGQSYTFTVTAANNKGRSQPSAASNAVAVPVAAPSAPTAFSATVADTTATLSWSPPADDGGAEVSGYVLTPSTGPAQTLDGSATSATVAGLTAGTTVSFSLVARNTVGSSVAATTSVTLPATPPASTPPVTTTLAVTGMATSLTYGSALPVSGRLTRSDTKAGLAARTVRLQYRRHGVGGYVTFPTAGRTTSTGYVSFTTFRPAYSVDVRLVFAAATGFRAATSAARAAGERAKVSIAASATKVRKGRTFVLAGTVAPTKRGHVVYLQRRSGSRWVTVTHQTLTSRSGYRFTVRASTRGTVTYRAYYAADGYQLATGSAGKSVRVS